MRSVLMGLYSLWREGVGSGGNAEHWEEEVNWRTPLEMFPGQCEC